MNDYVIQGILMDGYEFLSSVIPLFILFVTLREKGQKNVKDGIKRRKD